MAAVNRTAAQSAETAAESAVARHVASRRPEAPWRRYAVSILSLTAFLVLWQIIIKVFRVPSFIAPGPLQVLDALIVQRSLLISNAWPTLLETMAGFLIGNLIAIAIAIGFVHNRIFRQSIYPLAVTLRTLPIVAISPIIVLMFGLGFSSKVVIAAIITFFPTLVNMVDGLDAVDAQALELMHVLSASRWEVFRFLRWPTSLPYLFSALRIATTASLLGAIIAEWIGSNSGLGYLILLATYDYRTPLLYATMTVASALALGLFALVSLIERYALPWRQTSGPAE
jgi:NitT/TauT family transport system permease protein